MLCDLGKRLISTCTQSVVPSLCPWFPRAPHSCWHHVSYGKPVLYNKDDTAAPGLRLAPTNTGHTGQAINGQLIPEHWHDERPDLWVMHPYESKYPKKASQDMNVTYIMEWGRWQHLRRRQLSGVAA